MTSWIAHADPTKSFFIDMITRDIALDECIFDLLDNSVDGASKAVARGEQLSAVPDAHLAGYWANIDYKDGLFSITDNCGGISLRDAQEYAFHFGRRADAVQDANSKSIGLYGIGMKRAIFKIGRKIAIRSSTKAAPHEAFSVDIDVDKWAADNVWNFKLNQWDCQGYIGTTIEITDLRPGILRELESPTFLEELRADISRYYSFIIDNGFTLKVNQIPVRGVNFSLKQSDTLAPYFHSYIDEESGVSVSVKAGFAGVPSQDADEPTQVGPDNENRGWFIVCNDRVVLAGDKTYRTGWGNGFPYWHPQYSSFMGMVFFTSEDPKKLPWTTTKRQIDESDPLYQRAVKVMRDAVRPFLAYTNARKTAPDEAKIVEDRAVLAPIKTISIAAPMKLPVVAPKVTFATINYTKPKAEIDRVAEALGIKGAANKKVGEMTFDYYVANAMDE